MNSTAWFKNPEMIVGLSALVVSLVAVFVGIYSAYVERAYARASVWPGLEVYQSTYQSEFKYGINNNGTGPALIKQARVTLDGQPVENWRALFDAYGLEVITYNQSQLSNRILPPQGVIEPVVIRGASNLSDFVDGQNARVNIELCYCSIYDECWLIDRVNVSKPVKACTWPEHDLFLQ